MQSNLKAGPKKWSGPDKWKVKQKAQGRWLEIFQALAPDVLGEAVAHLGEHVRCPFHGGENDFRLLPSKPGKISTNEIGTAICTCGTRKTGLDVIMEVFHEDFQSALRRVDDYLGGSDYATAPAPINLPPRRSEEELRREREKLLAQRRALWNGKPSLDPLVNPGVLARVPYLQSRGIAAETLHGVKSLRYCRHLPYFEKKDGKVQQTGAWPAMLALMRDEKGNPVAIHRTWLDPKSSKKAPVSKAKKLTQSLDAGHAAIQLFPVGPDGVLGIAEGIETGLAARELANQGYFGPEVPASIPVWATFSSANISNFKVPENGESVKVLIFFADNDANGTSVHAINAAKERLQASHPDIRVLVFMPKDVGYDWLDVLNQTKHRKAA